MIKIHLHPPKPAIPFIFAIPNAWDHVSVRLKAKGTKTTYEYPTERARKSGNGEKQRDTVNLFVALVPHARVEDDSGNESTFHYAKEETGSDESGEILGDAS